MLTSAYKVGGWDEKRPKTCLRYIRMVPKPKPEQNQIDVTTVLQICFATSLDLETTFGTYKTTVDL